MTLVEAFRVAGPCTDPSQGVRRSAACVALYEAVQLLARRLTADTDLRQDLVGKVFLRLVQQGPRGQRAGDPATDEQVRAFLFAALRNGLIDEARASRRFAESSEVDRVAASTVSPEGEIDRARAERELDAARRWLFRVAVPELAARMRPGVRADFVRAIEDLRAIASGEQRVESIVDARFGPGDVLGVNRLHQQHTRARRRLRAFVESQLPSQGLPPLRVRAVEALVATLRAR